MKKEVMQMNVKKIFGVLSDHSSVFEVGNSHYKKAESRGEEEQISDIVDP